MIVTAADLDSIKLELHKPQRLSFDTETYGLLRSDRMFSLIIGSRDMSYYFNFKDYPEEGVLSLPREALSFLKDLFANKNIYWYAQNAKFDLWRLYVEGIEVAGEVFCTEAMGRVLKNNHMKYSLAESAKRIGFAKDMSVDEYITKNKLITKVDIPGKDKQLELRHYDKVPFAMISSYGKVDAEVTYKLGEYLREEIFKNDKLYAVYLNELELTKSVFEMEKTGVRIDPGYIMRAWRHEERLILEAKAQFLELTGQEYTTSRATLVQIFQQFGDTVELNENKNYVLDKEALAKLKSPAAKIVQKIRYYEKRISSFYSKFMHFRDSENVIRPDFRQGGTETGRFSMRDPNLQQLSKKDKNLEEDGSEVFSVRGCFVPRPGTCFVQLDYSQQEYRLMADYANERKLIAKIMDGMDVHQATADLVGVTRDHAKTLSFGILYGCSAQVLADMLKIKKIEAEILKRRYLDALPNIENFAVMVAGKGRARGYIYNWLGRHCYLANKDWAYILPNHLIQGSGADVMKVAINKTVKLLANYKSRAILTVHDSLLLEMVPEEFNLIPEIKKIFEMIYPAKHGIVLTCDVEHSWKSLSPKDMTRGTPYDINNNP